MSRSSKNEAPAAPSSAPVLPAGRLVLKHLVFEKPPLFGLAAASGVATLFTQTGAIASVERISVPFRLGNASISLH